MSNGSTDAPRLFHVGGAVLDLVYGIDELPAPGGACLARSAAPCPGGSCHVLGAAAAQGMSVCYAGAHGTGPFADIVRTALARLDASLLLEPSAALDTGTCVVLVTRDGERTFVGRPGAEGVLTRDDLARLRPSADDVVLLSGFTAAHPGCRDALEDWLPGLDPDTTLVFDPAPLVGSIPPELLEAILLRTDWPSANSLEAAAVTGLAAPELQLEALLERHCPRARGAVVRAGDDGCRLLVRGGRASHVSPHAVRALDTSGAGDVHVGTFVARLGAGDSPERACRVANAAAGLSVTRPSGDPVPTIDEVRAFMDASGTR